MVSAVFKLTMARCLSALKADPYREYFALWWLRLHGLKKIASNYVCRGGEVDHIMLDGDTLVFVEVKYRCTDQSGAASLALSPTKMGRVERTATHFIGRFPQYAVYPMRFDAVAIEIMKSQKASLSVRCFLGGYFKLPSVQWYKGLTR